MATPSSVAILLAGSALVPVFPIFLLQPPQLQVFLYTVRPSFCWSFPSSSFSLLNSRSFFTLSVHLFVGLSRLPPSASSTPGLSLHCPSIFLLVFPVFLLQPPQLQVFHYTVRPSFCWSSYFSLPRDWQL